MRKRIYIKSWLELKPYNNQTMTDVYYLNLSNDIKKAITCNEQSFILQKYLDKEEMNLLACFLTSYFEDIISETNIWNSFIKIHSRLYGKQLPFYTLDDYYEEEINFQDVTFLIWYFLNTIQADKFITPINDFIFSTAEKVMDLLDQAWEYAPVNEHLKSYYRIAEDEEDYYIARNIMDNVIFKSYLFHTDLYSKLKEEEYNIVEQYNDDFRLSSILNMNKDDAIFKYKSKLLSLSGKEWTAEILGNNHSLSTKFLNISQKINGYFFYKDQDENSVLVEHIASGMEFKITKKSMDHANKLEEVDTILFIGLVNWNQEWWFSGIYYQTEFDADLIIDEKNSAESKKAVSFLNPQHDKITKLLEKQLQTFKDFNDGSLIAFLPAAKIESFCKRYFTFHNNSLKQTNQELKTTKKEMKNTSVFRNEENLNNPTDLSGTGLVFFNPKSGIQIALGINSAFPMQNNPYYVEENSKEHTLRLLMQGYFSPELVMYCIEHCKDRLPFFNEENGELYLNDIDFLLRFWKANSYHTQPDITYKD